MSQHEADARRHVRSLHSPDHVHDVRQVRCKGLFAEDMLPSPRGGQNQLLVVGGWNADIYNIDIARFDNFERIGIYAGDVSGFGERTNSGLIAIADREVVHLDELIPGERPDRHGVEAADEAATNQS